MADLTLLVVAAAVVAFLGLFWFLRSTTAHLRRSEAARAAAESNTEARARELAMEWQRNEVAAIRAQQREVAVREAQSQFEDWKRSAERTIRLDAAMRSQSVTKGKVAEQFIPYLPDFHYNPKDAKFIGNPIDFVVFDGLNDGILKEIVIVEVKTGASAMSQRERQVREAVQSRRISWREIRLTHAVSENESVGVTPVSSDAAILILVPSLGDSPQAVLNRWLVTQGARVAAEQAICEVETEKFVMEIAAPADGLVLIMVEAGQTVSAGDVVGSIGS
jgi:predicted Holliday junction resolvase-like endonuclease